jgi:hypothetical protein
MLYRCGNREHYLSVSVSERWNKADKFYAFVQDMGKRPDNRELGRYGDVGNYEPGNCSWQTDAEQKAHAAIKAALMRTNPVEIVQPDGLYETVTL